VNNYTLTSIEIQRSVRRTDVVNNLMEDELQAALRWKEQCAQKA